MFVPIANNLVVIGMLVWFHALVPDPNLATIEHHHTALVLLGHRHHRSAWSSRPSCSSRRCSGPTCTSASAGSPGHEAMRRITRLAGWTFGIVLSNQVALVVVLALADGARSRGRCRPTPTPTPSSSSPTA